MKVYYAIINMMVSVSCNSDYSDVIESSTAESFRSEVLMSAPRTIVSTDHR